MFKLDIYQSGYICNIYTLYNEQGEGILIDPGMDITKHINKLGINIKYILITHGHCDHITGLEAITKAFPNAMVYLSSEEEMYLTDSRYNLSYDFFDGQEEISYVPNNLTLVNDNDELNLLGEKVKVIHTPFHTRGSVCYYFSNLGYLFSGDTLFYQTVGRYDLRGAEPRKVFSSLAKLKTLPLSTKVYPGHDKSTTIERELKYNPYFQNER